MNYHQLTSAERYMIARLLWQGYSVADMAEMLGRHRSTLYREIVRNRCNDGIYRPFKADSKTRRRRRESRRRWYFTDAELSLAIRLIREQWSPEQVSDWFARHRILLISHQTLYRYIWYDRFFGGTLYKHLRQGGKRRRKRYGSADSRGVMRGKRHITERGAGADNRSRFGHWEIDTVIGANDGHCIVTLVERKSRYTIIGKLRARTTSELNRKVIQLIEREMLYVRTITADNGTEFHQFQKIENKTSTRFYFCTPYHSWERGTNENTNGLIRQYFPKGKSMAKVTQRDCDKVAKKLNTRPRKVLGVKTPEEYLAAA
jgi:transposase, IS30 family